MLVVEPYIRVLSRIVLLLLMITLWRRAESAGIPVRLRFGEPDAADDHLRVSLAEPYNVDVARSLPDLRSESLDQSAPTEAPQELVEVPPRPLTRFVIDSVLLAHAYLYVSRRHLPQLNGEFLESLVWGGGVMVSKDLFVVTQIVPVAMAYQSAGGARADADASIVALERLDQLGLATCMHFHNHPMHGRSGNRPSDMDRRFQDRIERGGSIAVGCIFSRDGFVRFFASDLDRFCVDVVGSQARKVSDNEFELLDLRNVPNEKLVFRASSHL